MKMSPFRIAFFTGLLCVLLLSGCMNKNETTPSPEWIQAHTEGELSSASRISIIFTHPLGAEGEVLTGTPIRLTPNTAGTASWTSPQTLTFTPEAPLENGKKYRAAFDPEEFARTLSQPLDNFQGLSGFDFNIKVIDQELTVHPGALIIPDANHPEIMEYQGVITTADTIAPDQAASMIKASFDKENLQVKLTAAEGSNEFDLRIPDIERGDSDEELQLNLKGSARAAGGGNQMLIPIPGKGQFKVLSVNPLVKGDKYIEILFSSPLSKTQDLRGLIEVKNNPEVQLVSRSNRVKIYSAGEWADNLEVIIDGQIRDIANTVLASSSSTPIAFPTEKPRVRFVGDGVILPTNQGTTVPIETMNLNAVMVEAISIHGQNVPQFLQVNRLEETNELVRVGETVWRKIIDLGWQDEWADQWTRHGLDLSPLLEAYPDGFFNIRLTFRHTHIEYEGDNNSAFEEEESVDDFFNDYGGEPEAQGESSFWDNYEQNQSWSYRSQRNNPSHPAYYQVWRDHNIEASKNVLISNIGIIAEADTKGSYIISVTDLRTARPVAAAKVEAFNFQNRLLAEGRTDRSGQVRFQLEESPFFIKAETTSAEGTDYGYLRMNQQAVRTTSHFDTGGVKSVDGVEGYIYGERGVWRPGDRIYLNFILQDKNNIIPQDHPVLFQFLDPFGQEVSRAVETENTDGFYSFYTQTAPKAPTGDYRARVMVGGRFYEKAIKVETIMPNRLKVNLNLGDEEKGLGNGDFQGSLASSWLHGAPASGLKADIKVHFGPSSTRFAGWDGYIFDDPAREIRAQRQSIFEGTLDDTGTAPLSGAFHVSGAPGRINAFITTRVFEPGGAFSTEQISCPFHPYDEYAGLKVPKGDAARGMLLTDEDQRVELALVDNSGQPVSSGRVKAEIFKLNWRWWWETEEENLVTYVSRSSLQPIASDEVEITDGRGAWTFQIHYPDWGRYLIRVTDLNGGHSAGKVTYIDWPGWAGRAQEEGAGGAAMLILSTDKTTYAPGEEMIISLPSSRGGRGLLTIEKSGEMIESRWFEGEEGTTQLKIKALKTMTPNVYAHVTYIQPHLQTGNDLPIRTYGVLPLKIEDPETRLTPIITTTASFRPEDKARITIREQDGRPMTYTLAMVDEGLLGITRFSIGNPWYHFYRKEASFLKTWDLYDSVAGAYSGVLNTLLAVGGGMGGDEPEGGRKTNRFTPVVRVLPPVHLDAGMVNTHEIDMPRYIGAVRIMVVAAGDGAYGRAEKEVPVKSEIMALGTAPRVLSTEESMDLPVTIFALDERIKTAAVRVEVEGPLKIEGPAIKEIAFEQPGEGELKFLIKSGETPGNGLIRIRARGEGFQAEHEIPLEIRLPSTPVTEIDALELPVGGTWSGAVNLPGVAGTNTITLEVSRIPPINLTNRLEYLLGYPHGCIEQTTSKAFPQLFLADLVPLTEQQRLQGQGNIEAALAALKGFQTYSGGFSYWPGQADPNEWGTNYAGHFLLEAERRGYQIPGQMKEEWLEYQQDRSNEWSSSSREGMRDQAYRLYTLALAGEPDLSAMNRLREQNSLDSAARWRLAMTYTLAGYRREAFNLANGADLDIEEYRETGGTYGSAFRDKAMILETLVLLNKRSEAVRIATELSEVLSGDSRLSTQETGYALMAMSRYADTMSDRRELSLMYAWNYGPDRELSTNKPLLQEELAPGHAERGQLTIRNTSSMVLFPRIITRGQPRPGSEKPVSNGLSLTAAYTTTGGTPADLTRLVHGEDLEITITVENRTGEALEEIALSHLLPSGWEVHNDRLAGGGNSRNFDYQDIRDDRVYTYFDLPNRGRKQIKLLVNNAYTGRFYLPLITAGPMYAPDYQAVAPGQWINIERRDRE